MVQPHVTGHGSGKRILDIASDFMDTTSESTQRHEFDFWMNFTTFVKSVPVQIGLNSKKCV